MSPVLRPPLAFAREKRLLLGQLALLAPLPLPFTEVTGWPVLALYWAALALFLARAARGAEDWLPAWALNLLGIAYLPILAADLAGSWRFQLLRPLSHLVMFTLVAKLCSLGRERDKWHALIAAFVLTLAAVGSSVHPAVVIYLGAMLALYLRVLARFASFHLLAAYGGERPARPPVPLRGFVGFATGAALLVAVPIFVLLPRLPRPFFAARSPAASSVVAPDGFLEEIGLDGIGRLRASRAVVFRFAFDTPARFFVEPRFKAATYEEFTGSHWRRSVRRRERLARGRDGYFRLAPGRAVAWMRLWQRTVGATELPLPVDAVLTDVPSTRLTLDAGGAAALELPPTGGLEYRAGLAEPPSSTALPPAEKGEPGTALQTGGVTPRIASLAARVMGEGAPHERARRLERHLMLEYEYTLDLLGRGGPNPIEQFLFESGRGHCEYFASAMVLMLRSQGIPARLVTGYLGAEHNPLEGYSIVRQSNRHAWVEAHLPGEGWRTFDPTPPAGRPGVVSGGWDLLLAQAWDFVIFRWDRYVLTFGVADQIDALAGLRSLWRLLWGEEDAAVGPSIMKPTPAVPGPGEGGEARRTRSRWVLAGLAALALSAGLGLGAVLRRRTRGFTATRAFARLRTRLERAGLAITGATPPLAVYRVMAERFPAAGRPGGVLLRLYLRESFGELALAATDRAALRQAFQETWRTTAPRRVEPPRR